MNISADGMELSIGMMCWKILAYIGPIPIKIESLCERAVIYRAEGWFVHEEPCGPFKSIPAGSVFCSLIEATDAFEKWKSTKILI